MTELPFYFVRRLHTGRWCVAHRVPGADVDRIDVECVTLKAAQELAADMEQQRECGWQIRNVIESQIWRENQMPRASHCARENQGRRASHAARENQLAGASHNGRDKPPQQSEPCG